MLSIWCAASVTRTMRDTRISPKEKIAFFREKANALHVELGRPEGLSQAPEQAGARRSDGREPEKWTADTDVGEAKNE